MKADRFFSVHYDIRHNPKIELLRDLEGGISALGRWFALMGILYDVGGICELTEPKRRFLMRELELDSDGLDRFLHSCAESDLIQPDFLEMGKVASHGICDELEYKRKKSEAGKKGNEKRWSANR